MSWLRRVIRRLFGRQAPLAAIVASRPGVIVDFEYMKQSFRQGEAFDPLSATVEE